MIQIAVTCLCVGCLRDLACTVGKQARTSSPIIPDLKGPLGIYGNLRYPFACQLALKMGGQSIFLEHLVLISVRNRMLEYRDLLWCGSYNNIFWGGVRQIYAVY